MKPILITGYVNPDLDGIAGIIAYTEFLQKTGKEVMSGLMNVPHDEAKYILDRFNIKYPKLIQDGHDFEEIILVDASELVGLRDKIDPKKVAEVIDHRKTNDSDKFPNAKIQIEFVGAAVTLIAEKFINSDINISKESAILICGAIISNTLNFRADVTTDRDKRAFEIINKTAQLDEDFSRELFLSKSNLIGSLLEEQIRRNFAWFVVAERKFSITQIEMIGARKLVKERGSEIIEILEKIKKELNLDFIFQTIIDLEEFKNFFVTKDIEAQNLLEKIFNVKFNGVVAERDNMILRKQIMPLLKEELEK